MCLLCKITCFRYKDLVEETLARIQQLQNNVERLQKEIGETKNQYHQCRIDILNARNARPAAYDRDTHVNLDMQMWITHNQTEIQYSTYPTTTTYSTTTTTYTTTYKTYPTYKPKYTTTYPKDLPV